MANENLNTAKREKNDEFYTQFRDIETEVMNYVDFDKDVFRGKTILLPCDDPEWSNFTKFFALNFKTFGIKKVISTSYNPGGHGRMFVLDGDSNHDGRIDMSDIKTTEMEADGDFRSPEVTALRDEADIIVTNPPFSLFREFLAWIVGADKKFLIIGNKNLVTYKEVFPLIKSNKMWAGARPWSGGMWFILPADAEKMDAVHGNVNLGNVPSAWFTNLDHGRRHEPLSLMSMSDNLRFNKKMKDLEAYQSYDNYDAIEVPVTKAIPSDFDGVMGVPISFLDKYCPEQFEILGIANNVRWIGYECLTRIAGRPVYNRILIRHVGKVAM